MEELGTCMHGARGKCFSQVHCRYAVSRAEHDGKVKMGGRTKIIKVESRSVVARC